MTRTRKQVLALPTNEQKKLATQIVKLRKAGEAWPAICEKLDIPGSITGRKLMRLYGGAGAEALIKPRAAASQAGKASE